MACEKLCKAHLCGQGEDPAFLRASHAHVSRTLPIIFRQHIAREAGKDVPRAWVVQAVRVLARKIELLAPAVNDGGRHPANCEYPWAGPDGSVRAPCDHNFELDLLYARAGRKLMKVLYAAVEELAAETPT